MGCVILRHMGPAKKSGDFVSKQKSRLRNWPPLPPSVTAVPGAGTGGVLLADTLEAGKREAFGDPGIEHVLPSV
jgi:hypothetical protein